MPKSSPYSSLCRTLTSSDSKATLILSSNPPYLATLSFQNRIVVKTVRFFSSRSNNANNLDFFANKSPYEVLEVPKSATDKEIKVAYFKMAKKYHPDVNPTDTEGAKQRFMIVSAAYELLKDPEKRREYDTQAAYGGFRSSSSSSSHSTRTRNRGKASGAYEQVCTCIYMSVCLCDRRSADTKPQTTNPYIKLCIYTYTLYTHEQPQWNQGHAGHTQQSYQQAAGTC